VVEVLVVAMAAMVTENFVCVCDPKMGEEGEEGEEEKELEQIHLT